MTDIDLLCIPSLIRAASRVTGLSQMEIVGKGSCRPYVITRAAISVIARKGGRSLMEIGVALKKDHTTVLHYIRRWGEQAITLEVIAAIQQSMTGRARRIRIVELPRSRAQHEPVAIRRPAVVPLPPGAEKLLKRGHSITKLMKTYPDWKVGRASRD